VAELIQGPLVLEPRLEAASLARRHVRSLLRQWQLDELAEPVLLLVSEVVTNALLHSGTTLSVRVERDGAGVRVSVQDGSGVPPVQRRRSTSASTGRGVQLLSTVADEWGWRPDGTGKVVWFRVLSADPWAPALDLDGLAEVDL
jgi:anti-sigma regulatory factor (Ser/Thr protein kinase)